MQRVCDSCKAVQPDSSSSQFCTVCGGQKISERDFTVSPAGLEQELVSRALNISCFTTGLPSNLEIKETVGLVFGTSSKQAFWGLSNQADRLTRAYEAALRNLTYDAASKGANAIVGITFALNNSTGSSAAGIAGSSEAVMLLGTAVVIES